MEIENHQVFNNMQVVPQLGYIEVANLYTYITTRNYTQACNGFQLDPCLLFYGMRQNGNAHKL